MVSGAYCIIGTQLCKKLSRTECHQNVGSNVVLHVVASAHNSTHKMWKPFIPELEFTLSLFARRSRHSFKKSDGCELLLTLFTKILEQNEQIVLFYCLNTRSIRSLGKINLLCLRVDFAHF